MPGWQVSGTGYYAMGLCTWDTWSSKLHWSGLCPVTSVFPCQYHSTIAPYSFIELPSTLYNISLPVLQFSPVSIFPPLLHTHSFIYHPRCIMFFSPVLQFSPVSIIPPLLHSYSFIFKATLSKRINRRTLGTLQDIWCSFGNRFIQRRKAFLFSMW